MSNLVGCHIFCWGSFYSCVARDCYFTFGSVVLICDTKARDCFLVTCEVFCLQFAQWFFILFLVEVADRGAVDLKFVDLRQV